MSHHTGHDHKPRSRYAVISGEQPVIDQGDPHDSKWMQAGGDARDRGRIAELISKNLTGSERMMVGLAWPGLVRAWRRSPAAPPPARGRVVLRGRRLGAVHRGRRPDPRDRGDRDVLTGRRSAPDRETSAALDSILDLS
jgi:hypothetical protein